jgi:peptidoglycan/LPS O-acetylase OafA/YrhL
LDTTPFKVSTSSISNDYRPDIDGLRAVAVLAVIAFHAGSGIVGGGFVGVDIFFVISGYLITRLIVQALESGSFSFLHFYDRRARRIVPAMALVIVATLVASSVILLPSDLARLGKHVVASAAFVANIPLFLDVGYFGPATGQLPLLHLWSLAIEEQLYLIHPLLLWGAWRWGGMRLARITLVSVLLLSLATAIWSMRAHPAAAFYLLPSRAWEFEIGALLALHLVPPPSPRFAQGLAAAGLAAILAAIFLYSSSTPFPGLTALLPCIGAAAIIHAGQQTQSSTVARILSTRPIVAIGLISYSLYLWHWPIFTLWAYYLDRPLAPLEVAVAITATLGLSILSWRFVEQPFRRTRGAHLSPSRSLLVAGGALLLIAAGGFVVHRLHGMPSRVPPVARAADAARDDYDNLGRCDPSNGDKLFKTPCSVTTDIFVWGDSHAGHFVPALRQIYGKQAVGQVWIGGCLPLPGVAARIGSPTDATLPVLAGIRSEKCRQRNESLLKALLDRPNIRLVVLGGAWSLFTEENDGKMKRGRFTVDGDPNATTEKSRQLIARSLERTVRLFSGRGIEVLLLGDVPSYPKPPSRCLAVSAMWGRAENCGVDTAVARRHMAYSDALLTRLATLPHIHAFFPSHILCAGPQCAVRLGDIPVYRDTDHLTASAARALAPDMSRALAGTGSTPGK